MPTISETTPMVLGSSSPRRREILSQLSIPFVVRAGTADEDVLPGEAPQPYVTRVALAKLDSVRTSLDEPLRASAACILVADTTVALGGQIMGKPTDIAECRDFIRRLSGRPHDVFTSFAIATPRAGSAPLRTETVHTRVFFRVIREPEIEAYAASGEGMDKAGGYGVQGNAAVFVEKVEGSYTNVVGLPATEVMNALMELGLLG